MACGDPRNSGQWWTPDGLRTAAVSEPLDERIGSLILNVLAALRREVAELKAMLADNEDEEYDEPDPSTMLVRWDSTMLDGVDEESIGKVHVVHRIRRHEGAVYLFADWLYESHTETGKRHIGVFYATADSNGVLQWMPTGEGVAFADIEPLIPNEDDDEPDAFLTADDDATFIRAVENLNRNGESLGVRVKSDGAVFFLEHRAPPPFGRLPDVSEEKLVELRACSPLSTNTEAWAENEMKLYGRSFTVRKVMGTTLIEWSEPETGHDVPCELCNEPAEPGRGKNGLDHLCRKCADGLP